MGLHSADNLAETIGIQIWQKIIDEYEVRRLPGQQFNRCQAGLCRMDFMAGFFKVPLQVPEQIAVIINEDDFFHNETFIGPAPGFLYPLYRNETICRRKRPGHESRDGPLFILLFK